jgi:hypothetical protein
LLFFAASNGARRTNGVVLMGHLDGEPSRIFIADELRTSLFGLTALELLTAQWGESY